ncbi:hypothetical protein GOP47_0003913 [Adiantum capillus-veneris]|uniref:Uncharacterized protein n=1 Tax=Adiantum capillus-veneris TaxID=13818 RepID=A0A9D4V6I6_ADICA|nr:hypothetical protein GOP47_0003913 [Adiantum capillus-veneris]
MRKSLWSPDEDEKLRHYVAKHGCGNWSDVAKHTGLHRCGKSCRLRWINYLRPDLKRGPFTAHEVRLVVNLHNNLGNSWSKIAAHLPGRTDNDVKNFWHSYTRSRRLQQQQRQRMDSGLTHDNEAYNANEEKPCINDSDLYNPHTISGVKTRNREEKEHGYAYHLNHHHELQHLPPLMFTSTSNIHKGAVDCKAPSINVDNTPPFHFGNIGNHKQLSYSQNTNINPITNRNHSNHSPHYPIAHLPPPPDQLVKATSFKPSSMIHNHIDNASECATAAIYKEIQSHCTPTQTPRSKLGQAMLYAGSFNHSTSSIDQASSSAVSSTSHIDSQASFDLHGIHGGDHEWSNIMFTPSMQVNYLVNSHGLKDDVHPAASFDQANSSMDSKPPDGLQSVIWRFLNQQDADYPAAPSATTLDQQRAHNHHFPYHPNQKPINSLAINSCSPGSGLEIQPASIQLPLSTDPFLNAEEAFSSSASLQYLQLAELAADCFS